MVDVALQLRDAFEGKYVTCTEEIKGLQGNVQNLTNELARERKGRADDLVSGCCRRGSCNVGILIATAVCVVGGVVVIVVVVIVVVVAAAAAALLLLRRCRGSKSARSCGHSTRPVSYTHLTLPTIYSV